jgi:hypothetical protein
MVRERMSMRVVRPTQTPERQPSAEKLEEAARPTITVTATPAHSGITFAAYSNLQKVATVPVRGVHNKALA